MLLILTEYIWKRWKYWKDSGVFFSFFFFATGLIFIDMRNKQQDLET